MEIVLVKIAVSVLVVSGLAEIAKKMDPALSGVLLGLPLGAGLTVYFISYEQGIGFLLPGIPWAIAGLASALLFCLAYLLAGARRFVSRTVSMVSASLAALAAFFVSAALFRGLELDIAGSLLLFLSVAAGNIFFLRFLPIPQATGNAGALTFRELVLRALIAGVIITGATVAAPLAGSRWAGILSSFPSTLYALLVIVHFETGNELYPLIIRNFARSISTLAIFYLGCLVLLPFYGLNPGFFVVYCIAASYLFLMNRLTRPAGIAAKRRIEMNQSKSGKR